MSSMTYVQVVAVDCAYHSACVVIGTENNRFLFEVGEGTQRLVIEHKVRIGKIGGIFLTSALPNSLGGLPGMMLTMDDAGCSQLDVYAPISAQHYLQATRNFMRPLGNFHPISNTTSTDTICKKKNELTVYSVPIRSTMKQTLIDGADGMNLGVRACFIAETPVIPGKFFIEKATELNIPKGPMYGKLKNGQSIVLNDGTVVTPDQVLGPPHPSQYIAVICRLELEDEIMMSSLFSSSEFQPFYIDQNSGNNSKTFHVMVHLSGAAVIQDQRYQEWLRQFGESTKHIFVGHGMSQSPATSFVAQTSYNAELNSLFGSVFPLVLPNISSDQIQHEVHHSSTCSSHIVPSHSLKYHILPQKRTGEIEDYLPPADMKTVVDTFIAQSQTIAPEELSRSKQLECMHQSLNHSLANGSFDGLDPHDREKINCIPVDTKLIFLGTGCAIPSKYRNVSGIVLHLPKPEHLDAEKTESKSSLLLDVGEGSWYQLMNMTPPGASDDDIALAWSRQIKLVWISHPHADHHLGLITIIQERSKILRKNNISFEPLVVIAPFSIGRYLDYLVTNLYPDMKGQYVYIANQDFDLTLKYSSDFVDGHRGSFIPKGDTNVKEPTLAKDGAVAVDPCKPCDAPDVTMSVDQNGNSSSKRISKKARLATATDDMTDEPIEESRKPKTSNITSNTPGWSNNKPPRPTLPPTTPEENLIRERVFQSLGIVKLVNIPVIHCSQSYGIILTLEGREKDKPWKLVYSGDTRPSDSLIYYGADATILIHEATFEEDKLSEAMSKKHSTIAEAVEVADGMHATRLILTHFSQRYHGVPMQFHPNYLNILPPEVLQSLHLFGSDKKKINYDRATIAFDFMQVTPRDLIWSPQITPLVACLFPAVVLENEEDELFMLST